MEMGDPLPICIFYIKDTRFAVVGGGVRGRKGQAVEAFGNGKGPGFHALQREIGLGRFVVKFESRFLNFSLTKAASQRCTSAESQFCGGKVAQGLNVTLGGRQCLGG